MPEEFAKINVATTEENAAPRKPWTPPGIEVLLVNETESGITAASEMDNGFFVS